MSTRVTITGQPVAEIRPVLAARPRLLSKADLVDLTSRHQADAGLTSDLERLAGDVTDHLDPA